MDIRVMINAAVGNSQALLIPSTLTCSTLICSKIVQHEEILEFMKFLGDQLFQYQSSGPWLRSHLGKVLREATLVSFISYRRHLFHNKTEGRRSKKPK